MVQLAAVEAQNPCRFFRVNLKLHASSRFYDFYGIDPEKSLYGGRGWYHMCSGQPTVGLVVYN